MSPRRAQTYKDKRKMREVTDLQESPSSRLSPGKRNEKKRDLNGRRKQKIGIGKVKRGIDIKIMVSSQFSVLGLKKVG
jgi:hypothetical protein